MKAGPEYLLNLKNLWFPWATLTPLPMMSLPESCICGWGWEAKRNAGTELSRGSNKVWFPWASGCHSPPDDVTSCILYFCVMMDFFFFLSIEQFNCIIPDPKGAKLMSKIYDWFSRAAENEVAVLSLIWVNSGFPLLRIRLCTYGCEITQRVALKIIMMWII